MEKHYLKVLISVMISTLLIGCAIHEVRTTQSVFSPHTFPAGQYESKVSNFIAILDASSSMAEKDNGQSNFDTAKDFVGALNQTLPADISLNTELRTFGHNAHVSKELTAIFYGPTQHSSVGFDEALQEITLPGGTSPLAHAIKAADEDLLSMQGQTAVIIVSDGEDTDGNSIAATENMLSIHGDRLCIYTVVVGNNPAGGALLEQVSNASKCGFSVHANELQSSNAMADFVNKVFLSGVVATMASDSDGDGVTDDMDRCPNTPKGATVNAQGCWILGGILFDTDKSTIKPSYYSDVDKVATIMEQNPALEVEIQGHTDTVGTAPYNMKLSVRRANSVMKYLVNKGINPARLTAQGFGLTMPTASNSTPEGRAHNRRVELKPTQQ
tara:strand:- start:360 stop:1514 length:1155 start_codon:yes stop_codon:yes gene_type:complete